MVHKIYFCDVRRGFGDDLVLLVPDRRTTMCKLQPFDLGVLFNSNPVKSGNEDLFRQVSVKPGISFNSF